MMMGKKVSVIVVHYGSKDMISGCLNSILQQTYSNLETIIVNNSVYTLDNNFFGNMKKTIINNENNNFYSPALNRGIRESTGDYVLVLNNDVILEDKFIHVCAKVLNKNRSVGIVSGKILGPLKKRIDSAGQELSKFRTPVERGYRKLDKGQYDFSRYIFGACGAVAFLRKEMLEEVKIDGDYFCKEFKMFYEDLDLNWRANNYGWRSYYEPSALAYHSRGSSTLSNYHEKKLLRKFYFCKLPTELKFHVIKNRYMTIVRNEKFKDFVFNLFWIIIYDFALWCVAFLTSPKIVLKIKNLPKYFKIAFKHRKLINFE